MRLPSIQALRAIESFDRHGTIWQAAEELHLTRSAVSHQMRLLERDLGFQLLSRVGTRVELTPRGRAYARDVRSALRGLAASAERNARDGIGGPVTVSCPPGFASAWLCHNIGDFHLTNPDITLFIETPRRLDDTSNPTIDVFVTFGTDNRSEMQIEQLRKVEFTPLCSPAYLNHFNGFPDSRSVLEATLLHIAGYADWEDWFNLVGLSTRRARAGIVYSDMNLVYASALAGQGIAMGDRFTCKNAIDNGQLVQPFDETVPSKDAYYIASAQEKLNNPAIASFYDWLREAMRNIGGV